MAITELDIGGAEKAFVQIAVGLQQLGWEVQVISLRDAGPMTEGLRVAGIPVTTLDCGGFLDIRAVWRMKTTLAKQQPQVLLTFLHQANIIGRLAGRWAGVPRIISSIRVADRRRAVVISERLTSSLVDHYVAVSQTVARVHIELCRIPASQMAVIRNGVDVEAIRETAPVDRASIKCSSEDIILLCVGRLSEQKAPLDVLKAFMLLKQAQPSGNSSLKLLFTGDGPLRSTIDDQIKLHGLQDAVQILGWRSDVIGLMKSANLLVLASHWEGLPNVILEAQAAGLPVIASSVDGCSELVTDHETGRLFPAGSIANLAEVLGEAIAAPDQMRSLGLKAHCLAAKEFQWNRCTEQFHELLRNSLDKQR